MMKTLRKGMLIASVLGLGACQTKSENSNTQNITGTDLQPSWIDGTHEYISLGDKETFEMLNRGYTIGAKVRRYLSVDNTNEIRTTIGEKKLVIIKDNTWGQMDDVIIAETPFVTKDLVACKGVTEGDKTYAESGTTGLFVQNKLIGFSNRSYYPMGSHICVDKLIGLKFCDSENREVAVSGCTIPVIKGGQIGKNVVILK